MMRGTKMYGVRRYSTGELEVVWIEGVHNGWWRGMRLPGGERSRGQVCDLLGRFETQREAERSIYEAD